MTLESFVDCEREDEPRWRIISDSRCLVLAFLDSREKSSGKQLYGKRERKSGLEEEEKRGKAIGKRGMGKKEREERTKSKKTLKSISASPGKIRYRESRSLRERARVLK